MNITQANIAEATEDLAQLQEPMRDGSINQLYCDGYYASSLCEKWGMSLPELVQAVKMAKQPRKA